MADKDKEKSKGDVDRLEEDDEFEEFPAEGIIKDFLHQKKIQYNDMHFLNFRLDQGKRRRRKVIKRMRG